MKRFLAGFCHRVAYSGLLALLVFDLAVLPLGIEDTRLLSRFLMAANLPVSLVSLVLPYDWHGLDFPFGNTAQTGARAFWNHILIAIPVYVALSYMATLAWRGGRRIWLRREPTKGAAALAL